MSHPICDFTLCVCVCGVSCAEQTIKKQLNNLIDKIFVSSSHNACVIYRSMVF